MLLVQFFKGVRDGVADDFVVGLGLVRAFGPEM